MSDYDQYDAMADEYDRKHAEHDQCDECGRCSCFEGLVDDLCVRCWTAPAPRGVYPDQAVCS